MHKNPSRALARTVRSFVAMAIIGGGFAVFPSEGRAATTARHAKLGDYDGDGKSDLGVYRPSESNFYNTFSGTPGRAGGVFKGGPGSPVQLDIDGNGAMERATFKSGVWYVEGSSPANYGLAGDIPVPGDYNGDKKSELAVYRRDTGQWFIKGVNETGISYGLAGDKPVPADYNGDGKTDLAVFRGGQWYVRGVYDSGVSFGLVDDVPVAADYDGNGRLDLAVFRPSTGQWFIKGVNETGVSFGLYRDIPVPADYNGDGKTDIAVFRNGRWYFRGLNESGVDFGLSGDLPLQGSHAALSY